MKILISSKIFADFPGFFAGIIVVRQIDNGGEGPEIRKLLRSAEEDLRRNLSRLKLSEHPHIIPWREAYRKFRAKKYRSSVEALTRLVLRGVQIRHINKLVDLYNYISIKYLLPVGGEDLDKIKGDFVLDYAKGDESFVPLGVSDNQPPKPGEVVYKDNLGALCRRWNWREGERTKFTKETRNAVLVVEGLPPVEKEIVRKATQELANLVQQFCGGVAEVFFLDKATQSYEVQPRKIAM